MKRRVICLLIFGSIFALSACKDDEVMPSDRFEEYVELWNEHQFSQMYESYLAEEAKQQYTEEDMVQRYEKIYGDLVEEVHVTFESPTEEEIEKDQIEITYPFHVEMETVAGTYSFDHEAILKKEGNEDELSWYVDWNPSYIFPQLEDGDTVHLRTNRGPRGQIFDRNGKGLAINDTLYNIGIVPKELGEQEEDIKEQLSNLLNVDVSYIDRQLNQNWVKPNLFVPIQTVNPGDEELLSKLFALPGVLKSDVRGRVYPEGEAATHLVGYTGDITAEELEKRNGEGYKQGDVIGKRGLELLYENELRGKNGAEIYIDKGNDKVTVVKRQPEKGKDLHLTIDANIQQELYKELAGEKGSTVAIDPRTGEALALVSTPSFDANLLTSTYYLKLLHDEENPLLNRFTNPYSPGSTFKPVTAAIALANDVISPEETFDIQGLTWQKNGSWGDYEIRRVTDPGKPVNLEDALMYSDNIYFGQTAVNIANETMVDGLQQFGFQQKIPFEYPLPQSKISNNGDLANEVLRADSGYGQGQIQVSLLHLATMYTPFVNNGDLVQPYLMKDGERQVWHENVLSSEHANLINDYLRTVIADPNGTGNVADLSSVPLAGKTGTAELKQTQNEEGGQENGLFVAYESDNPSILITMLIENVEDKGGSRYVAEKVKNVYEAIY
ncbi:penicillin-binding transpeptidase domain-containing protein [Salirhabdus salicampi]|uniref:penicillin-binding transpeptidase domain-containing protein n=1 Tax=Salirhabdus salicampi TaxID=476102 RepID=UPI0020C32895|nr:penicillin-binding transpeptidase domain-containing protein [Salirhabdus salicampi]MCP8617639.1 penicillin-binding transpeptidase domain-containing protein [Salirhabdus salicampi]